MKSTNAKPRPRPRRIKAVGRAQNGLSAGAKILAAIEYAIPGVIESKIDRSRNPNGGPHERVEDLD